MIGDVTLGTNCTERAGALGAAGLRAGHFRNLDGNTLRVFDFSQG